MKLCAVENLKPDGHSVGAQMFVTQSSRVLRRGDSVVCLNDYRPERLRANVSPCVSSFYFFSLSKEKKKMDEHTPNRQADDEQITLPQQRRRCVLLLITVADVAVAAVSYSSRQVVT